MSGHGGVLARTGAIGGTSPAAVPEQSQLAPGAPKMLGFRHFLDVEPNCRPMGFDLREPKGQADVRDLMSRLVRRMGAGHRADNPLLPSGYTYLLQLMAHDLVQSSSAAS